MAAKTLDARFEWENGVSFTLKARWDSGNWVTVVNMDENGHIETLWGYLEAACQAFVEAELKKIGLEMKAQP